MRKIAVRLMLTLTVRSLGVSCIPTTEQHARRSANGHVLCHHYVATRSALGLGACPVSPLHHNTASDRSLGVSRGPHYGATRPLYGRGACLVSPICNQCSKRSSVGRVACPHYITIRRPFLRTRPSVNVNKLRNTECSILAFHSP